MKKNKIHAHIFSIGDALPERIQFKVSPKADKILSK